MFISSKMSAHLSSIMMKSASRKALTLSGSRSALKASSGVKNVACSASAITNAPVGTFHRSLSNKKAVDDCGHRPDDLKSVPIAEPLPAVAYDFYDDHEDDHAHPVTSAVKQNPEAIVSSSAGGRITSVPPSRSGSAPASFEGRTLPSRKSGGGGGTDGGGSGRHRCPKCGTSVTFRHGDFEENTYYCATCSGWFLIDTNAMAGGSNKEYVAKNGSDGESKRLEDPQILMHHVRVCFGLLYALHMPCSLSL